MTKLTLIFARSHTVGGFLIRAFQWWAPWNHVAILAPGDKVINAVWHLTGPRGVVEEDLGEWLQRYSETIVVPVAVPDPSAGISYARGCIGQKYDHGSLLNMISRKFGRHADPRRKQCVSLAENAVAAAGRLRWRTPLDGISVLQSFKVQ